MTGSMKSLLFFMVLIFTPPAFSSVEQEVLKEGSFINAIEREDPALLKKRIQIRLKGPFPEFVDELFFLTRSGGTIFHALAGTQTHQAEFAEILGELVHIFIRPDTNPESYDLAGVSVIPRSILENTRLFGAIRTGKRQKIAEEMKNIFEEGHHALDALSYLHSRAGSTPLLPSKKNEKNEYHLSLISDSDLNEMGLTSLQKITQFPLYLKKDFDGLLPEQIAEQRNNLPAFDVLKDAPDSTHLKNTILGGVAGTLMGGFGGLFGGAIYFGEWGPTSLFTGALGAMAGMVTPLCLNSFKRKKIKEGAETLNSGRLPDITSS